LVATVAVVVAAVAAAADDDGTCVSICKLGRYHCTQYRFLLLLLSSSLLLLLLMMMMMMGLALQSANSDVIWLKFIVEKPKYIRWWLYLKVVDICNRAAMRQSARQARDRQCFRSSSGSNLSAQ
jgi:hypothetical protein